MYFINKREGGKEATGSSVLLPTLCNLSRGETDGQDGLPIVQGGRHQPGQSGGRRKPGPAIRWKGS